MGAKILALVLVGDDPELCLRHGGGEHWRFPPEETHPVDQGSNSALLQPRANVVRLTISALCPLCSVGSGQIWYQFADRLQSAYTVQ